MECFVLEGRKFVRLPEEEIGELVNQEITLNVWILFQCLQTDSSYCQKTYMYLIGKSNLSYEINVTCNKKQKLGILKLAFILSCPDSTYPSENVSGSLIKFSGCVLL